MLLTSPSHHRAVHVPVLLLTIGLLILTSGVASVSFWWRDGKEIEGVGIFSLLAGLGILALAFASLRIIKAEESELICKNVYGTKSLELSKVALGISVYHGGRGGPTYTVYALAESKELDLASAGSEEAALRLKERLASALLAGRMDPTAARASEARVQEKEAIWRDNQRKAQATVDEYYASGKFKRIGIWIAVGVLVYVIGMVLWFSSQS